MLTVQGSAPTEPGARIGWRVGDIEIHTAMAQVMRHGRLLPVERSGYALLLLLVEQAGQIVAKDELLNAGWPGRVVAENSLAKAIGKLRQTLGDDHAELIRSVHGYGYRLTALVEPILAAAVISASARASARTRTKPLLLLRPLAGLAILVLASAIWVWLKRGEGVMNTPSAFPTLGKSEAIPATGTDVIAVLPLRVASSDQSLGLLAEGIATYLREQLQRVPALRIVNRAQSNSASDYLNDETNIARELGANLIVSGELSHAGKNLRVNLRLFDARGKLPTWRQTFERPPADQATLLNDLTHALYEKLGDQPERWGYDPKRGRGTANAEAYRTFLRASTLFAGNNDPNSQRRTIAAVEQALDIDPDYADAWLMLGGLLGGSGYYADSSEELVAGRGRALIAMDRGLSLAPEKLDDMLLRSEMRLLYRFDWEGSWADIEAVEAQTTEKDSARLLIWKARYLASMGRIDEAIATGARSIALDPQAGARRNQGWHYLAKRDTHNARAVLLLQLEDIPENPHVNFYLALCDIFEGQPKPALRRLEHSSTLFRLLGTSIAEFELGNRAASNLALKNLTDQFAIADGYWVGAAHAWRDEKDLAFEWIERAMNGGDSSVMYLPFDPLLQNLRNDPRYAQLLARLKIPNRLPTASIDKT